jgi:hypothetical protein
MMGLTSRDAAADAFVEAPIFTDTGTVAVTGTEVGGTEHAIGALAGVTQLTFKLPVKFVVRLTFQVAVAPALIV